MNQILWEYVFWLSNKDLVSNNCRASVSWCVPVNEDKVIDELCCWCSWFSWSECTQNNESITELHWVSEWVSWLHSELVHVARNKVRCSVLPLQDVLGNYCEGSIRRNTAGHPDSVVDDCRSVIVRTVRPNEWEWCERSERSVFSEGDWRIRVCYQSNWTTDCWWQWIAINVISYNLNIYLLSPL